jgi:hypothetical protein
VREPANPPLNPIHFRTVVLPVVYKRKYWSAYNHFHNSVPPVGSVLLLDPSIDNREARHYWVIEVFSLDRNYERFNLVPL